MLVWSNTLTLGCAQDALLCLQKALHSTRFTFD
jgi:hypothetical protein